jgi:hypothetical protein
VDLTADVIPLHDHFIDENLVRLTPNVEIRNTTKAKDFAEKVCVFNHSSVGALKIAAIFHELAQTWAQIRWQDIKSGASITQDIRSLGKVTLVIDSWQKLPQREKTILLKAMTELRFEVDTPYFLIFNQSSEPQTDLEGFAAIDAERLPLDLIQLEQTLDLLLSSDTTGPDFNPVN